MADIQETKHDLMLKRAQITIAILVGVVSLIVALYNLKSNVLSDKSPGKISVTVVSDAEKAVGGAYVEILNSQSAIVNSGRADASGQYAVQNLAPGSYAIKVSASGYEPALVTVGVSSRKTTDAAVILRALSPGAEPAKGNKIRSALEDAGASWIKRITEPKTS